ncbi:phytase [Maricaulis sp.]|uniref:phytase n=1 Tax=Maricaulis sp. TaxID=1486257 RepID=UPI002638E485|nr:phytase [Maricaulis sp.]
MKLVYCAGALLLAACSPEFAYQANSVAETPIVGGEGDAADDPAIWPGSQTQAPLILGTDKDRGLYVYNLDGTERDFLPVGRVNNVDVRLNFPLPGPRRDIAVASDRSNNALAVFLIDPQTGGVEPWPVIPLDNIADPYGACLYQSRQGGLYAFVTDKDPGTVVQLLLRYDGEGVISGEEVRRFSLGTITEGCVADDRTGQLYLGEENVAIWRIGAEPGDGTAPELFADVDNRRLSADVEGLALIEIGETGGYLVASSQSDNHYAVYALKSGDYVTRFNIAAGAVDEVTHTDGIEIYAGPLGEAYPGGLMVVQDDADDTGGQNFKLVDLRQVRGFLRQTDQQ